MLYVKKLLFAVLSALAILVCCAGCHVIFPTTAEVYKNNWGITLPDNLEKQYDVDIPDPRGKDCRYEVFKFKNKNSEFLSDMSSNKNTDMQKAVINFLKEVKGDKKQYPDFSHSYEWRTITKNSGDDKLYIIYDKESYLLYLAQDML